MANVGLFACHCLFLLFAFVSSDKLARGWGDGIEWLTLDEGLKISAENKQPIMLVIHKTWCGACKALKPVFADNKEISALSNEFVMVNVQDDEEPQGVEYSPDGGYIPRILFLDPEGKVQNKFFNKGGNDKYKYYYSSADQVVRSMHRVLQESPEVGGEKNMDEL